MKKIAVLLLSMVLVIPLAAQDPVSQAKENLAKKHHDSLVKKAEMLLDKKKELEAELAEVDRKLEKLANGEDVKIKEETLSFVNGSGYVTASPYCCWVQPPN